MQPLAPEPYRSKTVSTIQNSKNMDMKNLNKFLLQHGMRIANGYGKMKDVTFRIAHMGEIQTSDVDKLLGLMDEFLAQMPK
jgi:aspartate aminotransferase-like enzyme